MENFNDIDDHEKQTNTITDHEIQGNKTEKDKNSRDFIRPTKFSKSEAKMIFEYFEHFIDNRIIPKKGDIMAFLSENPLEGITWYDLKNKIKVKILNLKKRD